MSASPKKHFPPGFQNPVKHARGSCGAFANGIQPTTARIIELIGSMRKPLIASSADCSVSSRILLASRPKMLPPLHFSFGEGRTSIQAGLRARNMLQMQPPSPVSPMHFDAIRTALEMSCVSAEIASVRLVPKLDGHTA